MSDELGAKRITLTLRRKCDKEPPPPKRLAFGVHETASDVIDAGRAFWRIPARADLRLCKADGGFPYDSWAKVGDMSARPEMDLVLVVRYTGLFPGE